MNTSAIEALTSAREVSVEIGGLPITLRATDGNFFALIESRYGNYLRPPVATSVVFDVEVRPDHLLPPDDDGENELRVWLEDGRWRFERGDFRAYMDPVARTGRILQSVSPYAIDSVLRIVHTLIQASQGVFLLHGASAIRNGRAFLFSGVSGAGKTTISRLAPADAILLTDEI